MSDSKVTKLSEAKKKKEGGGGGGRPLWESEIRKAVEEINKSFALILMGDKVVILREYHDKRGRPCIGFWVPSAFQWYWNKHRYQEGERDVGLGDLWLRHPDRRDYTDVVFEPSSCSDGVVQAPTLPNGWYNLWRGYSVQPAKYYPDVREHVKHFRTLYEHVLKNIARGREDHARYIWAWFADMIQRPTKRSGVGLVLRGKQGTGKTTVGDVMGSLIRDHYVLIDHPDHLVGKFNPHMVKCLFLEADEGFWAGDKTAEGRLKGLITSEQHMIEKKGVDPYPIENYVHLLVTSNNSWVVPAGLEERRWPTFDVGDGNIQDKPYFARLYGEMDAGGREHLLAYLMRFDLSSVDLNKLPETDALFEQKISSMSEIQSWWFDRLRDGKLLSAHAEWKGEVATDALYSSYVAYADRLGKSRKLTREQFGIELGRLVPEKGFKRNQKIWVQIYDTDPATGDPIPMKMANGRPARKRDNAYYSVSKIRLLCGHPRWVVFPFMDDWIAINFVDVSKEPCLELLFRCNSDMT